MSRKVLLVCGALSTLLYVAADLLGASRYPGYSYASQTISEMTAIGAPTRAFLLPYYVFYDALMIAFAAGLWRSSGDVARPLFVWVAPVGRSVAGPRLPAGDARSARGISKLPPDESMPRAGNHARAFQKRRLRLTAVMLMGYAILGLLWPLAPMHGREQLARGGGSATDTVHLAFAALVVVFILSGIALAAGAFGARFGRFSIVCFLALLAFGCLTAIESSRLPAGLPTPGLGIFERINVLGFMFWLAVLSITVLREQAGRPKTQPAA